MLSKSSRSKPFIEKCRKLLAEVRSECCQSLELKGNEKELKKSMLQLQQALRANRDLVWQWHRDPHSLAQLIVLALKASSLPKAATGFTLRMDNAKSMDGENSWAVGLAGRSESFARRLTFRRALRFLLGHSAFIQEHQQHVCFGGWIPEGMKGCIELSIPVRDKEDACLLGAINEQVAIFHLKTRKTLYLPD